MLLKSGNDGVTHATTFAHSSVPNRIPQRISIIVIDNAREIVKRYGMSGLL